MEIGYTCINLHLSISTSQSCIVRTANEKGVKYIKELVLSNLINLLKILEWNESKNIRLYRITSEIFPHMFNFESFPNAKGEMKKYIEGDIEFAEPLLAKVGKYAMEKGHRLTFHMSAYTHIASTRENVQKRSIIDVNFYTILYNYMKIPPEGRCLILHVGGVYDDKIKTMERWIAIYKEFPDDTRKMIALENDEHYYGVNDILWIMDKLPELPWCFDVFHNSISLDKVEVTTELLMKMVKSWGKKIPKFHLSEQDPNKQRGAHSLYVKVMPQYLIDLSKTIKIHIMLEAKAKEKALLLLLKNYS